MITRDILVTFPKMADNVVLLLAIRLFRANDSIKALRFSLPPSSSTYAAAINYALRRFLPELLVKSRITRDNARIAMATQEFTPLRCHIILCKQIRHVPHAGVQSVGFLCIKA